MDSLGRPVGQLLASLPLEERAERYRQFGAEAVKKAQEATDPDRRAEYLTMASGWHAMAVEAERYIGKALPGEGVSPDHDHVTPEDSH